jgi:hypothetical protein
VSSNPSSSSRESRANLMFDQLSARRWDLQFESTSLQRGVCCELRSREIPLGRGDRARPAGIFEQLTPVC